MNAEFFAKFEAIWQALWAWLYAAFKFWNPETPAEDAE